MWCAPYLDLYLVIPTEPTIFFQILINRIVEKLPEDEPKVPIHIGFRNRNDDSAASKNATSDNGNDEKSVDDSADDSDNSSVDVINKVTSWVNQQQASSSKSDSESGSDEGASSSASVETMQPGDTLEYPIDMTMDSSQ